jgi:xylulokinase
MLHRRVLTVKKHYLAIDLGTSALKAVIYTSDFKAVSKAYGETKTYHPKPTWAEQDPNEWWKSTVEAIKKVLNDTEISNDEIAGIGTCGQCHGPTLVDEECHPLHNCLVWPDLRSVDQAEKIRKGGIKELGIGPIVPYYTATKLFWLKENKPELLETTHKFLLPKDFIRTKLTHKFITDLRDAGATQMFDFNDLTWSKKLLDLTGIPERILPEIHPSQEIVGQVTAEAANETGLKEGTPVIAGCGDGSLEPVMQALDLEGNMVVYLGTAPILLVYTPRAVGPARRPHYLGGALSAEGGALLKWFKEQFGHIEEEIGERIGVSPYKLLDDEASKVEAGAGGLLFLPHMMGERNFLGRVNPYAKGVLFGLSLGHKRAHIIRALLEGVSFQLRTVWDSVREKDPELSVNRIFTFGGGAKSKIWRRIIADTMGLPVCLLNEEETATLNLACLISLGLGVHKDMKEIVEKLDLHIISEEAPNLENQEKYDRLYMLYKKLENSLDPLFEYTYSELKDFYW